MIKSPALNLKAKNFNYNESSNISLLISCPVDHSFTILPITAFQCLEVLDTDHLVNSIMYMTENALFIIRSLGSQTQTKPPEHN